MSEEKERKPIVGPSIDDLRAELERAQVKSRSSRIIRSTVYSLLAVVGVVVILVALLFPVIQISGTSMTETLQDRDIVVALNASGYKKGEVVAFHYNNDILIKRVIATAGDWVDIDEEGNVSVNGEVLDEPYVNEKALGDCNIDLPYQVPDGRNFVMGDHRATSIDSRNTAVGTVTNESVIGRVLIRLWPFSALGPIS